MRGISWLAERTLNFSRRTLLLGVSYPANEHQGMINWKASVWDHISTFVGTTFNLSIIDFINVS
jgi:hypothetical protein